MTTNSVALAIGAYRTAATQVHPLVAVVKLFDEVLRRIALAADGAEARQFEASYAHVTRATLILRGLAGNLRSDLGGPAGEDMARTLKQTYVTNMLALHAAYGKKDAARRFRTIRSGLVELRNAWAQLAGMDAIGA